MLTANECDFLILVDGQWSEWTTSTICSRSCGGGSQHQHRRCDSPKPANGGEHCKGSYFSSKPGCNSHKCKLICKSKTTFVLYFPPGPTGPVGVDGSWGSWKPWNGKCSRSCGGGTETWWRECDSPAPAHGGKSCPGSASEKRSCNTQPCSVPGNDNGNSCRERGFIIISSCRKVGRVDVLDQMFQDLRRRNSVPVQAL